MDQLKVCGKRSIWSKCFSECRHDFTPKGRKKGVPSLQGSDLMYPVVKVDGWLARHSQKVELGYGAMIN